MEKIYMMVAVAAGLFALLAAQGKSYAQYGDGVPVGSPGITEQMLAKCAELDIDRTQCTESNILAKERKQLIDKGGSGVGFLTETGQMVVIIGALGAVFGGIAGAFFLTGRSKQPRTV